MKILILKTSALGDIIQSFPAVSYLRAKFPQAQIDWVVEKSFETLLNACPFIDNVITVDTKKWRSFSFSALRSIKAFKQEIQRNFYDYAFDLQGNTKSSLILWMVRAKEKIGFGWKTVHEWPNCFFTSAKIDPPKEGNIREDYLGVVKGFFKDSEAFTPSPIRLKIESTKAKELEVLGALAPVLVCPGAAWPNKCLSFESLSHVLKRLDTFFLFAWGTTQEKELCEKLQATFPHSRVLPKLTIPELQFLMSHSKKVIAMDSLPLHLCATTSTPTLSFFGPSLAKKFAPLGHQHTAIQGACPYNVSFEKRCPYLRTCPTGACMKNFNKSTHF